MTISGAPDWAERGDRPATAKPGTWFPNASAFGDFAGAVARRYSGGYPDPRAPGTESPCNPLLPVWNEPNLNTYLSPQWEAGRPAAPGLYRDLLATAYPAIRGVHPENLVVGPGLAPYGDPRGEGRMKPVRFLRELWCLDGSGDCRSPVKLSIFAHNPINADAPRTHAEDRQNATTSDLSDYKAGSNGSQEGDLSAPTYRRRSGSPSTGGRASRRVRSAFRHASRPAGSRRRFFSSGDKGCSRVLVPIQRPTAEFGHRWHGPCCIEQGETKPALQAFRFPFVIDSARGRKVHAWGIAPASGELKVEWRAQSRWRTLSRVRVQARVPFTEKLRVKRHASLRASIGGESSLIWKHH